LMRIADLQAMRSRYTVQIRKRCYYIKCRLKNTPSVGEPETWFPGRRKVCRTKKYAVRCVGKYAAIKNMQSDASELYILSCGKVSDASDCIFFVAGRFPRRRKVTLKVEARFPRRRTAYFYTETMPRMRRASPDGVTGAGGFARRRLRAASGGLLREIFVICRKRIHLPCKIKMQRLCRKERNNDWPLS
jgi:hypothetical protein